MNSPFKIITVCFTSSSKEYSYFCDLDVKKGDRAVVHASGTYSVVKIMKVKGLTRQQREAATQLVYAVLDTDGYTKRLEVLHAYFAIKEKLSELKEQSDELLIYQTMAKDNPEMQVLLKELEDICEAPTPVLEKDA